MKTGSGCAGNTLQEAIFVVFPLLVLTLNRKGENHNKYLSQTSKNRMIFVQVAGKFLSNPDVFLYCTAICELKFT